jgi:hypothetical protein
VRVFPESLQAVTQQAVETRATNWATLGWISPTAAMRAINAGTTEGLLESYMDDVGRMNHIIQLIKQGPQVLFSSRSGGIRTRRRQPAERAAFAWSGWDACDGDVRAGVDAPQVR